MKTVVLLPDTYQTFGKKTFWVFFSKWIETPFVFLIIAFAISLLRRTSFIPLQFQKTVALISFSCFLIAIVIFVVCIFAARFVYKGQTFCLSTDALKIRKGIFTKQEIAIPYRQIQNVEIERTFFQQISGVSKITIVTAGHDDVTTTQDESRVVIETMDRDVATVLQEELLRRADVQKVVTIRN